MIATANNKQKGHLNCKLLLTIATAIAITAIVASRRVLVPVDVGDRRADGNGYEDEESREAAYRPRLRHPRDDGGQTPRPERFITKTAARLIVIFRSPSHGTIRSDPIEGRRVTIEQPGPG